MWQGVGINSNKQKGTKGDFFVPYKTGVGWCENPGVRKGLAHQGLQRNGGRTWETLEGYCQKKSLGKKPLQKKGEKKGEHTTWLDSGKNVQRREALFRGAKPI